MGSLVAGFVSPLVLGAILLALAVGFTFSERWSRLARRALVALLAAGWALGTTPVADAILSPLERPYVVAQPDPVGAEGAWIVVLAAGAVWDPTLPPGGWMRGSSLYRVTEGVRLQRLIPRSTLLLMGGAPPQAVEGGLDTYPFVAELLGAAPERIRFEPGALNTRAEALLAGQIVPPDVPLYLVTSASHLRRALYLFRGVGLRPVPAPAHADARQTPGVQRRITIRTFLPSAAAYAKVDRAAHEYVGMLWAWMRGQAG